MHTRLALAATALGAFALSAAPSQAVTYGDTITFTAELVEKNFTCYPPDPAAAAPCVDTDPHYNAVTNSFPSYGLKVGDVVDGEIRLDTTQIVCTLGGKNCFFGDGFLFMYGGPSLLDFGINSEVSSSFNISTGRYFLMTDYLIHPVNGERSNYGPVSFALSDIVINGVPVPAVPLPGGLPLLLGAVSVLGLGRRFMRKA
ncbi:hypothetical protein [Paracoccus sp. (in: a-proteobacteria)]|uniref:hypothetical protein n=1 Tax=Paracoccus sp. TaxID=267 RepID=UPI003A835A78